ncbi:MAG TPA: hypothetical protein DCE44_20770, partial [Verrucomicrobiales bacterium]|nr:hypothetical protein [Verrucomicrobiales bacterium]
ASHGLALACLGLALIGFIPARAVPPAPARSSLPSSEIGAKAGADYRGDGLAVSQTAGGARMKCVFQRLEGEATTDGLWLGSTVTEQVNGRFRVVATRVGHIPLARTGIVTVAERVVRFIRPGLVEEYAVSMDGVRQDFVVVDKPALPLNPNCLRVDLAVTGARVESSADGVQLVLQHPGHRIAYRRLKVTDATGRELSARIEVNDESNPGDPCSEAGLAVVLDDRNAVYPIRIDPTFSDANWIGMGGIPGANAPVYAAVVDGSGNLYIGGAFTVVGDVVANRIAKWNGSSWSALGSGIAASDVIINSPLAPVVLALALSGNDLYAGGVFKNAGGTTATNIARWDGTNWAALGSGVGGDFPGAPAAVKALTVAGGDLYAGGEFTKAGGLAAKYIAQWNGSSWSVPGLGMGGVVNAMVVSGNDVYAGGWFTEAGVVSANNIAKWDGSNWAALGSGMDTAVSALAVAGGNLYAGGQFTKAGGLPAKYIAQWDGNSWSALGSGMSGEVNALGVSGGDVYVGGWFTRAGAVSANNIAKWNGSNWSGLGPLGSGNDRVHALAVSSSNVYVGGNFSGAAGIPARHLSQWNGSSWKSLGSGMSSGVTTLVASDNDVFVGGAFINFPTADGVPANYVAKWNESIWSALGAGMNNAVGELAVSGTNVYAGGEFTRAGGVPANRIAKWNGSNWSPLGSGMNDVVAALAVLGLVRTVEIRWATWGV